jgi:oxygen-dependent protoporphyrinogen oxidase
MRQMEREHGSLFLASLARARQARRNGQERPRFISFRGGSDQLIQSLANTIDADLRLQSPVENIKRHGNGFRVECTSGDSLPADAVLLATPSNVSASLLFDLAPEAAASMQAIRHADIGTLLLAFPPGSARPIPDMTGLMIPRREGRLIDAVTWLNQKMPGHEGQAVEVVKIYFGGSAPHLMDHDDPEAAKLLLDELSDLLSIQEKPLDLRIHRWPEGYPQADVGHLDLVNQIEGQLPPGIFTAGSSYRGLAVPDCIRQADRAAEQIIEFLSSGHS